MDEAQALSLGFRVQGIRFRIEGSGCRISGALDLGLRVKDVSFGSRI